MCKLTVDEIVSACLLHGWPNRGVDNSLSYDNDVYLVRQYTENTNLATSAALVLYTIEVESRWDISEEEKKGCVNNLISQFTSFWLA